MGGSYYIMMMYVLFICVLPLIVMGHDPAEPSCEASVCRAVEMNGEAILASRKELGCCVHGMCTAAAPGTVTPSCSSQLFMKMAPCLQINYDGNREHCLHQAVVPGVCGNLAEKCEGLRLMTHHLQLTSSVMGCAMREGMAWWTPLVWPAATIASLWPTLIPPFISQQNSVDFQLRSALTARGIALVGGLNHREGNVYARDAQGRWGAVCGNNFGAADANVVCQQAGFSQVISGRVFGNSRFGNLPFGQQFVFTDLTCDGTENSIVNCPSSTVNNGQCQPNTVAGVECA